MKRLDILIIGVLCFVGLTATVISTFINRQNADPPKVEIYVAGALYRTVYPTDKDQRIDIRTPNGYNTLVVYPDGAKMADANCPFQSCVHTAKQTSSGGIITCLPHAVIVKLSGNFK